MRALVFLNLRRFVNSLRRIPGTPRLLLPYLLFGVFFLLQVALYLVTRRYGDPTAGLSPAFTPTELIEGGPGALIAAVRGILILHVFTATVNALGEGNLVYSASDVDFLFSAPLRRRQVLLFRMLGRYMALLLPAAYLPLLIGGALVASAGVNPLGYLPGVFGSWLFMVAAANVAQTVVLNRMDARDAAEDGAQERRRSRVRAALSAVVLLLAVGLVGALVLSATGNAGRRDWVPELLRFVNSEAAGYALLPVAWASDLFRVAFEGWTTAAYGRLAGLFALAAASLALLFSRDRDFYEGAMDFSQRASQVQRAVQQGNAGTILSQLARDGKLTAGRGVREFGGGAWAIFWKDAVFVARTPARSWLTLLFIAAFPALSPLLLGTRRSDLGVVFWLVMFTITTSSLFLLGLRDMLRRADITKALPIAPTRMLAAELAFSVFQMTLLGWFSLLAMALLGTARGPVLLAAFVSFPTLAALMLPVQTIFLLLYPASNSDAAQSGVSGLLSMLASTLALVPSLVVGALLVRAGAAPLLVALGVSGTNLAAALAALGIAAVAWQRFDPTD